MREILFRGKSVIDGEWLEGYFVHWWDGRASIVPPAKLPGNVDPDTVGQYTGLTDKHGKKIFEGDILQVDTYGGSHDRCIVGFGEFQPFSYEGTDQVGFYLYWKSDKQAWQKYANIGYWLRERKAICIGNIHDNPELIKED